MPFQPAPNKPWKNPTGPAPKPMPKKDLPKPPKKPSK